MKPIPEAIFNQSIENLKYYGFIKDALDGGIELTDKGDGYLERIMHDKPELFVLMFLFYLSSTEDK